MQALVDGECDARLVSLRDFIADELQSQRALGLAVAVVVEGRTVAHLWGGFTDRPRSLPWMPDTLAGLFSAGKPLAASALLLLLERGLVALDAPIVRYWPEFAQAEKSAVTVRHALAHLAGVPIAEQAPNGSVFDRDVLVSALAAQQPLWPAGKQLCFHSFTHGILVSELVRRSSGRPLGQFFREHIARPFGLDIAFELDADEQRRCAELVLVEDNPLLRMMRDPATMLGRSWRPMRWDALNSAAFRGCDFPSAAGHASALGLARFYAMMANEGRLDGRQALAAHVVREALAEQRHEHDVFMGAPVRMGLGFMLANEVFPLSGPASFGQPGLGGVAGVGDSERRLGIGVASNLLSGGLDTATLDGVIRIVRDRL